MNKEEKMRKILSLIAELVARAFWAFITGILSWALLSAALTLFGCMDSMPPSSPVNWPTLVVVVDPTTSIDGSNRCSELGARISAQLEQSESLETLVLAVGRPGSGYEPTVIVQRTRFEPSVVLFERPGAMAETRQKWVKELVQACEASIRPTSSSSIYRAIFRAVETLEARCADMARSDEVCVKQLAIHSDLSETEERGIACRLAGDSGKKCRRSRLPVVDTTGIELSVCGVSNTRGSQAIPPERISQVWAKVLGRKQLRLEAGCPTLDAKEGKQ